jgi:hypothetical protein
MRPWIAAAVLALTVVPAARADTVRLVDPTTALTRQPPLAPPAGTAPREQEAPSAAQRVDSRERIITGLDATGRPVSVTVEQRLRVTGTGDYLYTVPAPVLGVTATADSQSAPGERAGAILWAGFSDRRRTLGGRARLRPGHAAPVLPLEVAVRTTVDGRPVPAGERRDGTLRLQVALTDATAVDVPSATAAGDRAALVAALAVARRGRFPPGGVGIPVHSGVAARTARIEAPLAVQGEIAVPGRLSGAVVRGATLHGGTLRFALRLGDDRPLVRTIELTARATGVAAPRLRIVARTVPPRLVPPGGGRWGEARIGARRLLDLAEDGFLRAARAHQYDAYLANPGPPGGRNAAEYLFVSAPDPRPGGAPAGPDGRGVLGVLLIALGALAAAVAALAVWAHL